MIPWILKGFYFVHSDLQYRLMVCGYHQFFRVLPLQLTFCAFCKCAYKCTDNDAFLNGMDSVQVNNF